MKRIPILLFLGLLLSCSPNENLESICYSKKDPPIEWAKLSISQGIAGHVWFWKGNFMPVGRGEICQVERVLYIHELTSREEVDRIQNTPFYSSIHSELVTTLESDEEGFFQIELEPGSYSLFLKEGEHFYSNSYNGNGEIFRVDVESGAVTEVHFDITYEAAF